MELTKEAIAAHAQALFDSERREKTNWNSLSDNERLAYICRAVETIKAGIDRRKH